LRSSASRLVSRLFEGGERPSEEGLRIPVDVFQNRDSFRLSMDLPGVARGDLVLYVAGSTLVVEGHKREAFGLEADRWGRERVAFECAERAYGAFRRVVDLPGAADTSRIDARLERGVLCVTLPRISERRGGRREVPIG
jgi:HSP20 family protein